MESTFNWAQITTSGLVHSTVFVLFYFGGHIQYAQGLSQGICSVVTPGGAQGTKHGTLDQVKIDLHKKQAPYLRITSQTLHFKTINRLAG